MIGNLRRRDISFSLNFVFGTDTDDESVFPATMEFWKSTRSRPPISTSSCLCEIRGL